MHEAIISFHGVGPARGPAQVGSGKGLTVMACRAIRFTMTGILRALDLMLLRRLGA